MKRIGWLIVSLVIAFTACGIAGCKTIGKRPPNVLSIGYTKAGYGEEWMLALKEKFEAENEGITIDLEPDEKFQNLMMNRLTNGTQLNDLMFGLEIRWHQFASEGKLESLDDVYASVDENGVSLEQRMKQGIRGATQEKGPDRQTHYYTVPWNDGASGIAYNAKMFREHNWAVPTTVPELITLCKRIKAAGIAPFTFPGLNAEYWRGIIIAWWAQYDGVDAFYDFFNFESPDVFLTPGLRKAVQAFQSLSIKANSTEGCMSKSHIESQMEFAQEKAAMIPNGAWLEKELSTSVEPGFEIKLMPTPYIDNDHKLDVNWTMSGDQALIPSGAPNKELAKKFLIFMNREDNLKLYTELTGAPRPFDYDTSDLYENLSVFGKSVFDIWLNSNNLYNFSTSDLWNYAIIGDIFPKIDCITTVINGRDADELIDENAQYAKDSWASWQKRLADLG